MQYEYVIIVLNENTFVVGEMTLRSFLGALANRDSYSLAPDIKLNCPVTVLSLLSIFSRKMYLSLVKAHFRSKKLFIDF